MTPKKKKVVPVKMFFDCVVDAIEKDFLRVSTRASDGVRGVGWIPLERIPEGEKRYIQVCAPFRIWVTRKITKYPWSGLRSSQLKEFEIHFFRPAERKKFWINYEMQELCVTIKHTEDFLRAGKERLRALEEKLKKD